MKYLIAACVCLFFQPNLYGQTGGNPRPPEASIRTGLEWLAAQDIQRTDVLAFLYWISGDIANKDPILAQKLRDKTRLAYEQKFSHDFILRKLLNKNSDLDLDKSDLLKYRDQLNFKLKSGTLGISKGGTQDFLLLSLYPDNALIRQYFQPVRDQLFKLELDRYGTTHQVLALHFLKENSTTDTKQIDDLLRAKTETIARDVEAALLDNVFTDLLAERLAVLALEKRFDLVKPQWTDFLLASQNPDGSWSQSLNESNYFETDITSHATVLAIYFLLQCSLQRDGK